MKVAVIPARGGSKRIPRKNIRRFAGRPIIAYSIETALHSRLFDRVIVSTDDAEIAQIARDLGAEVPFVRPADLSDEHAGTTGVICHAISWLQENQAASLSAVCCMYATAPFMQVADLRAGLELFDIGGWDFVFSATSHASSVWRSFCVNDAGGVEMLFPDRFHARSQDLQETLHDAAQFYWGSPKAWLSRVRVFDRGSTVVRIPRWRVQDIDTEEDWWRAEAMAAYLQKARSAAGASGQSESG